MPSYLRSATLGALLVTACQDPTSPGVATTRSPNVAGLATRSPAGEAGVIPGRYVVRLRAGAADPSKGLRARVGEARSAGWRSLDAGDAHGFVATLSDAELRALAVDPDVAGVEPDRTIVGSGLQLDAPWGLDRIDQRSLPLGGTYLYSASGTENVTVYVLDSGISTSHVEFDGRASMGPDYVGAGTAASTVDCNGHGTHVAGVIGGRVYGVAKAARLVGVRVLDCSLRGTMSQAIAAIGWVVQQKKAHPGTPAVLNMSLEGTGASTAFDQAVAAALDAGITVVVAAGNAGADACASSPSRVAGVLAVAASDRADGFAPFSNRGSCIALAAPGVDVASAWAGSDREVRVMSGTSVAAPFVSGAAALYLAQHPSANPDEVRAALVTHATSGALTGVPIATPNRLLAVDFLQGAGTGLSPTGVRGPRLDHF